MRGIVTRRRRALVLALALLAALGSAPSTVAATPPYQVGAVTLVELSRSRLPYVGGPVRSLPPNWPGPKDSAGIPMREVDGKLYYHPVGLALNALQLLDGYGQTGDSAYLTWARKFAAKLRAIGVTVYGALWLPYRFDYASEGLRAPWYSGMAQGLALSLFVRLFRITRSATDLDTAHALFSSFRRIGPSTLPWVVRVDSRRYVWLEEYPRASRFDLVLNGLNYAVFGLYDYWQQTHRAAVTTLLKGVLTTLRANVGRYRVAGGISLYCLYHRTRHAKYHAIHVWQVEMLGRMTGDSYFTRLSALLASDYP